MWVKALDMVLDRLVVQGANLSTVVALSGSAQVFSNEHKKICKISYILKLSTSSNTVRSTGHNKESIPSTNSMLINFSTYNSTNQHFH